MKKMSQYVRFFAFFFYFMSLPAFIEAQQLASTDLPEAPPTQQPAPTSSDATQPLHQDPQTKRILGIFPNFRAVSSDVHLPPQSVKDKFVTATEDSFDYSSFLLPALLAGEQQATNATPD
jgi:hypothetical protein